jgi:hypothetical protein
MDKNTHTPTHNTTKCHQRMSGFNHHNATKPAAGASSAHAVADNNNSSPTGNNGLDSWTKCRGYLEKKSQNMGTFNSRYFVLEKGVLSRYTDSDRVKLLSSTPITTTTRIEALAPQGNRNFVFSVIDTNSIEKLILSASTAEVMEMWMIALIQASQGEFADAERFSCDVASENTYTRKNAELPAGSQDQDANPTEKFYVNDSTLLGRLRKANIANPEVHLKMNTFYMQYFAYQCDYPGFILIRVCENQRYLPIKGWNCLHLLPTDPAKLSSAQGEKFPYRYLKSTDPPLGYHWPTVAPIGHAGWCVEEDTVDSGWKYAPSFGSFPSTLSPSTSAAASSSAQSYTSFKKSARDYVRRRIWRRYAQLTADPVRGSATGSDDDETMVEAISLLDSQFLVTTIEGDPEEADCGPSGEAVSVGSGRHCPETAAIAIATEIVEDEEQTQDNIDDFGTSGSS